MGMNSIGVDFHFSGSLDIIQGTVSGLFVAPIFEQPILLNVCPGLWVPSMDIAYYSINSFFPIIFYYSSRIPHDNGKIRNIPNDYRTGTNGAPFAHFYHGDNRSPGPHVCAFTYFHMAGQGNIWGDVHKISDFVVMVDQGPCIDDYVLADFGPRLHNSSRHYHCSMSQATVFAYHRGRVVQIFKTGV